MSQVRIETVSLKFSSGDPGPPPTLTIPLSENYTLPPIVTMAEIDRSSELSAYNFFVNEVRLQGADPFLYEVVIGVSGTDGGLISPLIGPTITVQAMSYV